MKGKMEREGDAGVAVMTDPSPTESSLTFRIAREHRTPGERMKHRDATIYTYKTHTGKTQTTLTRKCTHTSLT